MGSLTTHVLDVANGRPAAGVAITVKRITAGGAETLARTTTNADGRCDAPLVSGDAFTVGQYEIIFAMGEYFDIAGPRLESPPFLQDVAVRFGVAHAGDHYHVPLLVSPYSYTTYRGS